MADPLMAALQRSESAPVRLRSTGPDGTAQPGIGSKDARPREVWSKDSSGNHKGAADSDLSTLAFRDGPGRGQIPGCQSTTGSKPPPPVRGAASFPPEYVRA